MKGINTMANPNYPQNLLDAIAGNHHLRPRVITEDICAGFRYAVATLPWKHQELIQLMYVLEVPLDKIREKFEMNSEELEIFRMEAIYKLRDPCVYPFILYGVVGRVLHSSIKEFFNGYRIGYEDAQEGKRNDAMYSHPTFDYTNNSPSIEQLKISKQTKHCLYKAGIITIYDCLMLRETDIRNIHGLGPKRLNEVAQAIVKANVYSYKWEKFLDEPVKDRHWYAYNADLP